MAKVSLRQYIREINSLIEENHIREAKEHCAYILKSYPKYIDVYRLLGKAHLESRRYDEAEKIFVRVLAVLPDDFISHLGLSVVKEEQENLDGAIWHMERAYELKSTQTIHEELHRLFTLRDGVAPPKPLITRGALIRINVRSGLYQQALKEIDLALKEDPQRLDLEILRAQIYFQQKNIPLAIRYCKLILQQHPYAYDANLLMTEIASTSEQAEPFKQKLFELDPYTSLVDETTSLENIPDDAIKIERLEIQMQPVEETDEDDDEQEEQDFGEEDLPQETLDELENPPVPMEDSTLLEAGAHESAQIPDWMKEMGWEAGSAHTPEEEQELIAEYDQLSPALESPSEIEEEVIETEIPDWLKDLEPVSQEPESSVNEEEVSSDDEEKIAWLTDILSEEEGEEESSIETQFEVGESLQKQPNIANIPEFGEDLEADQEWLEKISSPEQQILDPNEQSLDRRSRMPEPEEIMDFSYDDSEEEMNKFEGTAAEPTQSGEEEEDIDSAIAWLEGLAAKQGAEEEVLFSPVESRDEKPEWLEQGADDEFEDENEDEFEEPAYVIDELDAQQEEFDPDTYFEELDSAIEETSLVEEDLPAFGSPESLDTEEDEESAEDAVDVPEWLKTIAPPESVTGTLTLPEDAVDEEAQEAEELEIPEELESLFMDDDEAESEDVSPEVIEAAVESIEQEETEEKEPLFAEFIEEEAQTEELPPQTEGFATTAVLDFIKQEVDNDIDEIDNWLKNLPDHDAEEKMAVESTEEIPEMEEEPEETISMEDENSSVEFIDDFFTADVDASAQAEETVLEETEEEPYQWQQEFDTAISENNDIPDWIASIEEDEAEEVITSSDEEVSEEKSQDAEEIPEWINPDLSEEETAAHSDETLEFNTAEDTAPDQSWAEVSSQIEETQPEEDVDYEEIFLIAKNKLHNGDFAEAFPRLEELINEEAWLNRVMEALIFDIENYHPIEVESWVLLGDAYRKQGKLKEALDAYTKAEEFIK